MAKASVTKLSAVPTPNALEFLNMNAAYNVAPDADPSLIHEDIACWLESIHATVKVVISGLDDAAGSVVMNPQIYVNTLYGTITLIEMVQGALSASYKLDARAANSAANENSRA